MTNNLTHDERVSIAFRRCGWMKSAIECAVQNIAEILATSDIDTVTAKRLQKELAILRQQPNRAEEIALQGVLEDREREKQRLAQREAIHG